MIIKKRKRDTKCYIRFGDIPKDGVSKRYGSDTILYDEKGVSVWECAFVNGVPFPLLPEDASESAMADYFYMLFGNRPVYLVTGTELKEKGSANEPLLDKDITVIREYTKSYEYLKKIHTKINAFEKIQKELKAEVDKLEDDILN